MEQHTAVIRQYLESKESQTMSYDAWKGLVLELLDMIEKLDVQNKVLLENKKMDSELIRRLSDKNNSRDR